MCLSFIISLLVCHLAISIIRHALYPKHVRDSRSFSSKEVQIATMQTHSHTIGQPLTLVADWSLVLPFYALWSRSMLYHSKLLWKAHLSIPFCFRATSIILSCSFYIHGNISYFPSDKMPQHKATEVSEGKRIGIYFGIKDDQSIKLETNFTNEKIYQRCVLILIIIYKFWNMNCVFIIW